jgi:hypothetical protein
LTIDFTIQARRQPICGLRRFWVPEMGVFSSYFPHNAKLCVNGHEYAKKQLQKEGIAYQARDNGILACARGHAPGPPQSLNEEEAQSGQPLVDGVWVQLSLAEHMRLVLADVLGPQAVRRTMKVTGKILHRRNVTLDGPRRVVSTLEFFEHHLA